jgi:glycosyltransferase involved in cell wall biosynthesis
MNRKPTTPARTLVIAHAHPAQSLGGGEIAAYAHWSELKRQGDQAVYLARAAGPSNHTGTPFSARAGDGSDLLFHAPPVDHFRHSQTVRKVVYEDFRALLERVKPTAVHFHHYVHLGLELVREVRRYSADIPIFMTLHDYLGICHAQGQMLKTNGMLCQSASPMDCNSCFPGQSPQLFFMRELFVKSFFELVDVFVSPSRFLRDRYVAWGLPAEKFMVLENGQAPVDTPRVAPLPEPVAAPLAAPYATRGTAPALAPTAARGDQPQRRFVVLGQLSRLKGTQVLLEAVRSLDPELAAKVRIEIHGSIQHADEAFKTEFHTQCKALAPTLRFCGPYLPQDVNAILGQGAWLIVPSVWWENSPMVIQEALRARCPVIVSNIGGMAEKVDHGVNGLHFRVNSASDLARTIEYAASDRQVWQTLSGQIKPPPTLSHTVKVLATLYGQPRAELGRTLDVLRLSGCVA